MDNDVVIDDDDSFECLGVYPCEGRMYPIPEGQERPLFDDDNPALGVVTHFCGTCGTYIQVVEVSPA